MRLKRGLERQSCDFCHRRKIKCDRSFRLAGGNAKCSGCELRQIPCNVDDSNDIRIRRKRQTEGADVVISDVRSAQEASVVTYKDPPSTSTIERTVADLTSHDISPDIQNTSFGETSPFILPENLFDLSAGSILFLDQIFMGDLSSSEWSNTPLSFAPSQEQPPFDILSQDDGHHGLWESCNIDSATFNIALNRYFTHAALCLPILLQDAFWQDYEANRCCHALIYAIACRGMPFTDVPDKWEIQQRLADKFKAAFFEHQSTPGRGAARLDDIEALAVMANFQYEKDTTSSIPPHMEKLFLSHDSLVMMTLQYRLEDDAASSEFLSRTPERRTLLFWYIYGLDAFNNLDYKRISRFPEADDGIPNSFPNNEAQSYLDAILSIAIIARTMLQKLCTATSKSHGIKPTDIEALYDQLYSWRSRCPSYLRRGENSRTYNLDHHVQLQRCVVRLLEVNCYMQIESFVREFGIRQESDLDGEMACFKVEYESLRAVKDGADLCTWMELYDNERSATHALVDLAPTILRDICAGLCVWTSIRGKRLLQGEEVSVSFATRVRGREPVCGEDLKKQKLREYLCTAKLFRSTVARAVSHRDTETTLARADMFLKPLMHDLEAMLGNTLT